jgi:hypothetical protein
MATDHDTPAGAPLDPLLAEAINGLRDRGPEHDLWTEIAPRLAPRRPAGVLQMRWPTALAAGLALVAGSAAVTQWLGRSANGPSTAAVAVESRSTATAGGDLPVVTVAMDEAGTALQSAITDLTATIEAALPQLDPATRDELSRAMAALDLAVTEAADRVREAPEDLRAAQYLTTTLRRQHAVLRTIAVAASRS